ncbi:hypothetical protein PYW07_009839 [Mythimna separata]|uniref:Cytochrome P450 n=1 Tax=Mythimna separata TaxID=271217 RepID=A0AAD7YH10_MYTSE|nr:hypothetical protein PYW07_009839 [Mythimna separata]
MFAVVVIGVTCAVYWWWRRQSAKTNEPPYWPGAWPFVGHAPLFIGDACSVTDPDDCYTVATTCLEKDSYYDFVGPWLGDGLVTSKYAIWKDHHKHLHPAFSQAFLDTFMGVFNTQSRRLVKSLEKNAGRGLFDHYTNARYVALETICCNKFKSFMDILLELSVEKGVFSDKQITEHVDTLLIAGHETTAHVLTFTMVLLGSYPDVQEKAFSEIKEVLGEDRDVEKMDLSKLTYLEAVLKESLRVITVAPVVARKVLKDVKLSKTYAMMSMKTTLAHVVRSYKIKADHTKLRLKYGIVLKPDNEGYYISIEKRT